MVHSIKGNAGFFKLVTIKNFSRVLENTLDDLRNGKVCIKEDLQRAVVDGLDILDGMLQRVLDGDATDELADQESELLAQVGRLAKECRVEVGEDELPLDAAESLADETEKAQLPQSSDWGRRVRAMISNGSAKPAEQSSSQKQGTGRPASNFERASFRAAGEYVTERVAGLLELFLATERDQFTQELGAAFLERAAQFETTGGESNRTGCERRRSRRAFTHPLRPPRSPTKRRFSLCFMRVFQRSIKSRTSRAGASDWTSSAQRFAIWVATFTCTRESARGPPSR